MYNSESMYAGMYVWLNVCMSVMYVMCVCVDVYVQEIHQNEKLQHTQSSDCIWFVISDIMSHRHPRN